MNNTNNRTDEILKTYFAREQTTLTYNEPKKHYFRYTSIVAAALVLIMCVGFFAYSALQPKNEFVISVSAMESTPDSPKDSESFPNEGGRVGLISFKGNNIDRIEAHSVTGDGEFVWITNNAPEKYDLIHDADMETDKNTQDETNWNNTLLGYINTKMTDDTVEVTVYYKDGTSETRSVFVTYNGNEPNMIVEA